MKILFLYPNSGSQVGFNYGVAHIAGVLKAAGHAVSFWQLCEDLGPLPTRDGFVARLRSEPPDLLAFSVVTNQWAYARQLATWAKEAFPLPCVIGGIHALFGAEEILATGLFDAVFRGECEEAFLEFVDRQSRGESVDDVRNLAFVREGRVVVNPVRPLPDLEALPRKDYGIMDFQRLIDAKKGWVGLMASRGCPFSCTYCFNHRMVSTYRRDLQCSVRELGYIRRFPVACLMEEIQTLLSRYERITTFIFDDDLFTFDKGAVKEFCQAYRQVTTLPFVVNAHVGFFDREIADMLAEAGCRMVKFGLESGSPAIRHRILNRHMTNGKIIEAIRLVNERQMHSSVFVIIGFPFESRENVQETLQLLSDARPGRFRWTYFFPYPGTRAHDLSVKGGYIDARKMETMVNFTDESCLNFGGEHNLFLRKVGRIMPWFVNACSSLQGAKTYQDRVREILEMDEVRWDEVADGLHEEDRVLSERLAADGLSHYAIQYNPFMGVLSDYFLKEREAANPVP